MRRVRTMLVCLLCALAATAVAAAGASASTGAASWGGNAEGQLGNGTTSNSNLPGPVSGLTEVTAVSAGGGHSLALLGNGTVMAWGANGKGQLGNGTTTSSDVPVAVSGLTGVKAISAGGSFSLALLSNGTVMAWGENTHGQLGNGTIANSDVPVAVSGLSAVTAVGAGANHGLALLSNGTVMAWGDDAAGQLGNGTTNNGELLPVAVSGLSGVTGVSAGESHSLALLGTGGVMAWGADGSGQLGNGTTTNSNVPVAVSGLSGATSVSAGANHSLAVLSTGTAMAWGSNTDGQLGNGTTTGSDVPVAVSGLTEAIAISGGGHHSLALLSSGHVMAWGSNAEGQLGTGGSTGSHVPVAVSGLNEVKGVDAGTFHSLAVGPQLPNVTGVSPNVGPSGGGTSVTITGTNFTGATSVRFGAIEATEVTVNSATMITAKSPAGSGVVDVTVTAPAGTSPHTTADQFSYLPTVTGVSPNTGPQAGGTSVTITGTNFSGTTAVRFGAINATEFTVNSPTMITAKSPAGFGAVDVTVVTPGGTSATSSADRFTYEGSPPEFGRCVKVATGTGLYGSSSCTSTGGEQKYAWLPGPGPKPTFTTKIKLDTKFSWQGVGGAELTCTAEKSSGQYTGPKTVGNVVVTLNGCLFAGSKCTTAGAREGEIITKSLAGELGIIKTSTEGPLHNQIGLDLKPATGEAMAEFSCGGVAGKWRGSVIVPVTTNKTVASMSLKYAATGGKQKPESFEGMPKDVIESSLGASAFEQSGWVLTTLLTNAEKMEVNSVV